VRLDHLLSKEHWPGCSGVGGCAGGLVLLV